MDFGVEVAVLYICSLNVTIAGCISRFTFVATIMCLNIFLYSVQVYGFSWIVLLVMVLLFKVSMLIICTFTYCVFSNYLDELLAKFLPFQLFTATPKKSTALPTFIRFLQGILALGIIAGIVLLIVFTRFTIADLFASALAFIATGWCVLCVSATTSYCIMWVMYYINLLLNQSNSGILQAPN